MPKKVYYYIAKIYRICQALLIVGPVSGTSHSPIWNVTESGRHNRSANRAGGTTARMVRVGAAKMNFSC